MSKQSENLIKEAKAQQNARKLEKTKVIDSETYLKGNKNPIQYTCCNVEITPIIKDYGRCPDCSEQI
tara:strand:- start:21229 stop:21429 length:201 start_codon:yes stop_codon:yes gene_type:complete